MQRADRETEGLVFNIQKFSVNDGPGIRTAVFLKGCPLRCLWCANPESQAPRPQILRDPKLCVGCGACEAACPHGAARVARGLSHFDASRCEGCGACAAGCPTGALKQEGARRTVGSVLETVLQDRPFYEESGGGLTVSGGELLAQPRFAEALLRAAREEGLHCCCETTGFAAAEVFDRVTEPADLLLFDVKHWDEARHIEGTGVSNALPLSNMKRAIAAGKDVLPRIPVIPGYNDSAEDADGLARRLLEAGAGRCQLLPFHQFGENKYTLLERDYAFRETPALHREELEEYRLRFVACGVEAFF